MMVVVASRSSNLSSSREALAMLLPDDDVVLWPDPRAKEADVVIGWDVPADLYEGMCRLRLVHGLAAGVDNLIRPSLAGHVPVCRIVDAAQARGMAEYVHRGTTYFHRGFDAMARARAEHQWIHLKQSDASSACVGVMGLGHMGLAVSRALLNAGYRVRGWSRSPKRPRASSASWDRRSWRPFCLAATYWCAFCH